MTGLGPLDELKPTSLIDPTFLFRFELDLHQDPCDWSSKGLQLPGKCKLPSLGALGDRPVFADVRMGWCDGGIGLQVNVNGKRQLPWCRDSRLEDSDGFHVWIDTRCSPLIHRATQYCHRFLFMPAGGGPKREHATAAIIPINRARLHPKSFSPGLLKIVGLPRHDGYQLSGFIPKQSLTGFDPKDNPRISLYYAVIDRELGWQTLSLGPEYPVMEDPSLWGEAVLRE